MTTKRDEHQSFKGQTAVITLLSDVGTPLSVFEKLSSKAETAFLFESTEADSRLARFSIMGFDPIKLISIKDGIATIKDTLSKTIQHEAVRNPFSLLKQIISDTASQITASSVPDFLPFTGGLVGYLGYAAVRYFEDICQQPDDPMQVPEGLYGLYDSVVIFDHLYRHIYIVSHRGSNHAQLLCNQLIGPQILPPLFDVSLNIPDAEIFRDVSGPFTKQSFCAAVSRCQEYIRQGQVFQIVISQRFSLGAEGDPLNIYRMLQSVNPSPYAYFMKFSDFVYVGSSPETFVKCKAQTVTLRALAGTRARGTTIDQDERLEAELRADSKELAEHRMLVDLGRNDLGRVCEPGTILVGEIGTITRYAHVMHLSTEITGHLKGGKDCFDLVESCFPRGTVSGAPKIRAMQLLSEVEPEQRGIYSGVVGYFDLFGNTDGAIAIRSALLKSGQAHVNAGAGVVYDSNPECEYEESRNKARSVIKAIKMAECAATS